MYKGPFQVFYVFVLVVDDECEVCVGVGCDGLCIVWMYILEWGVGGCDGAVEG